MTITNDPSTPSIHQQHGHPLDQEGKGRSDKQSPNRAGIRMPGRPRPRSENGQNDPCSLTSIGPFACDPRGV